MLTLRPLTVEIDLLDEFSNTQLDPMHNAPNPPASGSNEPIDDRKASNATADEFNRQLQKQMAALLGNADETPEMRKEIEAMMRELGAAADPGVTTSSETDLNDKTIPSRKPPGEEDAFQETIRKTMERMQSSGEQATAAATSEESDDIMAQMFKEMHLGGLTGAGGEEDFSKMLLSMMEQLTNKDILYEPMKELHEKFPAWMRKNKDSTKSEDLLRYEEQRQIVGEIVAKFEEKGYSDSKAADREYIVERMQKVRRHVSVSMLPSINSECVDASSWQPSSRPCEYIQFFPLWWPVKIMYYSGAKALPHSRDMIRGFIQPSKQGSADSGVNSGRRHERSPGRSGQFRCRLSSTITFSNTH